MSRLERAPNDDWRNREAQRRRARGQQPESVDLVSSLRGVSLGLDFGEIGRYYEKLLEERRIQERKRAQAERDAPTFSECVIGYRQWALDPLDQLWPITVAHRPWEPGINTAVCDARHTVNFWISTSSLYGGPPPPSQAPADHRAPHADCECGLYAWRRIDQRWLSREGQQINELAMPPVIGAVAFWGDIRIHREGFRAENACVVTLAHHDQERPEVLAALERAARRYRVDLVPISRLEAAASRHGTPLPDSLKPPAPVAPPAGFFSPGVYQQWLTNGAFGP